MGLFERFLSIWVALAIVAGVLIGQFAPSVPETLSRFEYAQVSIPVGDPDLGHDLPDDVADRLCLD